MSAWAGEPMTEPPFPDLHAHMCYSHHWPVDEVESWDPLQMLEMHDAEHGAGYSHHHHEEPV